MLMIIHAYAKYLESLASQIFSDFIKELDDFKNLQFQKGNS